ncbi:MAG: PRC-barrel domain-containing protein [Elusimicrobiota bacterium]
MLITARTAKGYALQGVDGPGGKVVEFYFDDRHWEIRYLIADAGGWLARRRVLISSTSLRAVDAARKVVAVDMTKQQIRNGPPPDADAPVSRQLGAGRRDPHLRSTRDMSGHRVQAVDGEIGRIEDFVIDAEPWEIRQLVINKRDRWPASRIMISPQWVERTNSTEANVFINLRRDTVNRFPPFDKRALIQEECAAGTRRRP